MHRVVGRNSNSAAVNHWGLCVRKGEVNGKSTVLVSSFSCKYGDGINVRDLQVLSTLALVGLAVVLELRTGSTFVVIHAAAVESSHQAMAHSLVLTGVWATRVVLHLPREEGNILTIL